MHRNDIASLCTLVSGIALEFAAPAFGDQLNLLTGGHGQFALAVIGAVSIVASQVSRIIGSPSSTPDPAPPVQKAQ